MNRKTIHLYTHIYNNIHTMKLKDADINPATGTEACSFRLPVTLLKRMEEYMEKTGATKTGIVCIAVDKFLEDAE